MLSKILTIFATALLCVGCFIDEAYDTQLQLKSLRQEYSGEDGVAMDGVVVYGFKGDLENWGAESYEGALAGVVYDFDSGLQLTPFVVSEPDPSQVGVVLMQLEGEVVMLLAVDTVNQIFAVRNYSLGLNLATTYISIQWRPWKSDSYTEGGWSFDHSSVILTYVEEEEEEELEEEEADDEEVDDEEVSEDDEVEDSDDETADDEVVD